jgi:hypothetical protein
MVHLTVSSHRTSVFPNAGASRRLTKFSSTASEEGIFRGCSYSFIFRPPGLLATQAVLTLFAFAQATVAFTLRHTMVCYLSMF